MLQIFSDALLGVALGLWRRGRELERELRVRLDPFAPHSKRCG